MSKITQQIEDAVQQLYMDGTQIAHISRKLQISTSSIYIVIRKYNLYKRRESTLDKNTIIQMYNAGTSLTDIGKNFGVSRQRIHQILKRLQIEKRSRNVIIGAGSHPRPIKETVIDNETLNLCIDGTDSHHWSIEEPNGQISKGTCTKCSQTKNFKNYVNTDYTAFKVGF